LPYVYAAEADLPGDAEEFSLGKLAVPVPRVRRRQLGRAANDRLELALGEPLAGLSVTLSHSPL
jgi:hypothetical protein